LPISKSLVEQCDRYIPCITIWLFKFFGIITSVAIALPNFLMHTKRDKALASISNSLLFNLILLLIKEITNLKREANMSYLFGKISFLNIQLCLITGIPSLAI
jgi:hypothetical protein